MFIAQVTIAKDGLNNSHWLDKETVVQCSVRNCSQRKGGVVCELSQEANILADSFFPVSNLKIEVKKLKKQTPRLNKNGYFL